MIGLNFSLQELLKKFEEVPPLHIFFFLKSDDLLSVALLLLFFFFGHTFHYWIDFYCIVAEALVMVLQYTAECY